MVAEIFTTIGNAITAFAQSLGTAVQNIASMFYDSAANSGAGGLTFLGTLLLIGVGVGVVYWAFRLIRGLIAQRRA